MMLFGVNLYRKTVLSEQLTTCQIGLFPPLSPKLLYFLSLLWYMFALRRLSHRCWWTRYLEKMLGVFCGRKRSLDHFGVIHLDVVAPLKPSLTVTFVRLGLNTSSEIMCVVILTDLSYVTGSDLDICTVLWYDKTTTVSAAASNLITT